MSAHNKMIDLLVAKAKNPQKTIKEESRATGKELIGCFPIYTPDEIVYASGHLPVGIWGGKPEITGADKYLQGFCCSIMRANLELGVRGVFNDLKAVIIPTLCDTLKCLSVVWRTAVPQVPMIGFTYSQNRWSDAGKRYLIAEYQRVRKEIEKVTGKVIPEKEIEKAYDLYEQYRKLLREFVTIAPRYPMTITPYVRHMILKAGYFMDKAGYVKIMEQLIGDLKNNDNEKTDHIKVVATGLIQEPIEVLKIMEDEGITVVADDIAQESRQFRTKGSDEGDIWIKMANRMIEHKGCAFFSEEKKTRGNMLLDTVDKNHARAVVVFMLKFCDPEEFDYPIYKKLLESRNIPVLYLELDQQMDSFEQIRTRIQSFREMLG